MKSTFEQLKRARIYRESHREQIRAYFREYHKRFRQKQISKVRAWRRKIGLEKLAADRREERRRHPERFVKVYERQRLKRKSNVISKLKHNCACRMRSSLRVTKQRKTASTIELLGAEISVVKKHIESLWLPGMTWENWSRNGWHIDHIRPLDSFKVFDDKEQRIAFHYTNLQPLWYADNIRKRHYWNE